MREGLVALSEDAAEGVLKKAAAKVEGRLAQTGNQALGDLFSDLLKDTEDKALKGVLASSRVLKKAKIGKAIGRGLGKGIERGVSALWLAKDVYMAVEQARDEYRRME